MKIRFIGMLPILLTAFTTSLASAAPADDALRLIETRPGVRFWATKGERRSLQEDAHHAGKCGGFIDVTDFKILKNARAPTRIDIDGVEPKEQTRVKALLAKTDEAILFGLVAKLSAYPDRNYNTENGVKAATWIRSQYEAIAKGRSDIKVDFFAHPNFRQPSVIAEIAGDGPNKNEIIVIGGHLDSISHGKAPGADDNASGTATVLETFRIITESGYRPNRTLLFMGYAGEEEGLLGSGEIAAWFRNKGRAVVGVMQFDMTMYPGSTPRITFITDHTNRALTRFTQRLADEYVKVKWAEDTCGYACSDHASWTRAGFASVFPFESAFGKYNPSIHTPNDTTDKLNSTHGLQYLKLSLAFAVEMAEANAPVWRLRR